eukprot:TRINITY_DN9756_c0_g1_i2.p1 TRINITY_DN9756_c0_g1~~TRINITY_DN9756_c0_g1_i2.p1  ORF type:complete len:103 (-),score=19.29 TRINITY_DN9756_c0_g1_i2:63-371(-)
MMRTAQSLAQSNLQSPRTAAPVISFEKKVLKQDKEGQTEVSNLFQQIRDQGQWDEFSSFVKTLDQDSMYNKCITLVTLYYFFERRTKAKLGSFGPNTQTNRK